MQTTSSNITIFEALRQVREQLSESLRLQAGEIDQCEECSEPIGFKRLLARPVTTLCITCKSAQEARERLTAR